MDAQTKKEGKLAVGTQVRIVSQDRHFLAFNSTARALVEGEGKFQAFMGEDPYRMPRVQWLEPSDYEVL